ncbi:hypothetical protein BBJ28_00012803 [Nothophytophthora sp. Chile5]|nr:hypothetical protein BBJ28_00012803 [Nothophytophthora sp. Chile5]
MGPRGAGRRLNDQERMEILEIMARESKVKNVDLAKRYGVSEGAIRKLKQIKDTIRDRYYLGNEHNRDKRKRGGFKRNAPFEQELYEWICRMRETQAYQLLPLTQTAVRQQAIVLSKNYERMANFKASPGWFARFCSRHRLDPPMTSAGSSIAISDAIAASDAAASAGAAESTAAPSAAVDVAMEAKPPATAEDTVFLMDPLVPGSVSATAAAVMVDAAMNPASAEVEAEGKSAAATAGLKQESPSINEQAQVAAREHNAAALNAATAREMPSTAKAVEEELPSQEEKTPSEPAEASSHHSLTKVGGLGGSSSSTASGSATPTSSNGSVSKKKKKKKKKSKSKQEGAASRDEDAENRSATSNSNGSNEDADSAQLPLARRLEVAAAIPDTHAALLGLLGWSRLYVNTDTILTFFQSDALPLLLSNVLRSHSPAAVFDNLAAMLANCLSIEANPSSADSSGSAPHREMANEVVAAVRTIADELHGGADAEDADADAEAERAARALSRLVCGHALSLHGVELGSPLTRDVQVLETKIAEVMRADESVHGQTIRDSFQRRDLRSDALTLHDSRLRKLSQLVEERVRSSKQQHQQVDEEEEGEGEEDADEQRQNVQDETEMKKVTEWLQEMQERKDAELAPLRVSQAAATAETQTLRQRRDELETQLRAVEDELQRVSGMQQQADEDVCAVEKRYLADTARFRAEHQHVARRFTRAQHRRAIAAEVARVDHEVRQAQLAHSQVHALRSKQAVCLTQQLEASLSYFESELPCMKFMLARVAENESELAPLRDEAIRYRTLGVSAIAQELEDKAAALEAHLEEDRGCLLALRTRDLELLDGMRCMLTDPALRDIVAGLDEKLKHEVQRMIDYVGKLYDLPVANGSTTSGFTDKGEGGVKV